jgi:putative acetyltransferase
MDIRAATIQDRDDVHRIYLRAFPDGENEIVSKLAIDLLREETAPRTISLVAEADGAPVGHVAFSPVTVASHATFRGHILAPLAVDPDFQRRRIGSSLIESGLQTLSAMGVNVVFVYGDPKYYGRFGFSADIAAQYKAPYRLEYPFGWQAIGIDGYEIDGSPVQIACASALCDPKLW